MSSRQLRKLQQQRELEHSRFRGQILSAEGSENDEENELHASPAKPSLFANLALLQDQDEGDDEDEEDTEDAHNKRLLPSNTSIEDPSPAKPKKSKSKNKKAKAKTSKNFKPVTLDNESKENLDEIDMALKELNFQSGNKQTLAAADSDSHLPELDATCRKTCLLLQVRTEHLKVANEMRNLFGRSALENHDDAGGQIPGGARRRQQGRQVLDLETALKGRHLPGRGFPEVTLRRNIFIQGKDDWPRAPTGGLSIEELIKGRADGASEFTFIHNTSYNAVQLLFDRLVDIGEPQNLIGLLQKNPYHISSLLQVSKIAKNQGDHALSSDLVERALFTFARATSSLFASSLSQGLARLQFARRENREFWLAGYQYIRSLVMKGTYRTALEWAKFLLVIDVSGRDPYCMLLMIHHLALRAHEFEWLLELSESSMWINATAPGEEGNAYASHITPSLAFAALQLKDGVKCRLLLSKSVQTLPWLFCKLFQELGLDKPPPSIWGAQPRTDAEHLFTEIYVRQTKDLWNTPEATALLVEVAGRTKKLHEKGVPKTDNSTVNLDVARFVYLDNTPALMALVPSSLLHRTNNSDSDPLPPENLDNPEGLHSFYDPVAAVRRLIPGWTGEGGADDERVLANLGLRAVQEDTRPNVDGLSDDENDSVVGNDNHEENGDAEEENVNVSDQPRRTAWLYNYLFGNRSQERTAETQDDLLGDAENGADREDHARH